MPKKFDLSLILFISLLSLHLSSTSRLSSSWLLDLTNHFRPTEMIFLFVATGILIVKRSKKLAFLYVAIAGIYLIHSEVGYVLSDVPHEEIELNLQVISFNVHTSNTRYQDVIKWIDSKLKKNHVNLVFLMETNKEWNSAISPLKKRLPYAIEIPRKDNFGLILLSDVKLDQVKEVYFSPEELPALFGYVTDERIRIAAVHPLPPVGADNFLSRNKYYQNLRKSLDKEKVPTVVFGDFNTSPWSKNFETVSNSKTNDYQLNLKDNYQNSLFRPHTWRIFGGLISVPIDYILSTSDFSIESTEIGPDLGSDHLPILSVLAKMKP